MKKTILSLSLITVCFIIGCGTLDVTQMNSQRKDKNLEDSYGIACPNPIYVATMGIKKADAEGGLTITETDSKLSVYNILSEAKKKYGDDVTIQNIRWDIKNETKISVIFDVIKCK